MLKHRAICNRGSLISGKVFNGIDTCDFLVDYSELDIFIDYSLREVRLITEDFLSLR